MRSRCIRSLHLYVVWSPPEGAQVHRLAGRKGAQVDIVGRDLVLSLARRHLEQSSAGFDCADGAGPGTKGDLLEITFHTGVPVIAGLVSRASC